MLSTLAAPSFGSPIEVTVGSSLTINFSEFTQTPLCNFPVAYSLSLSSPSFASLEAATHTITLRPTLEGSYEVSVVAAASGKVSEMKVQVTVIACSEENLDFAGDGLVEQTLIDTVPWAY